MKLILAKPGWLVIIGPRSSPPLITLNTPGGKMSANSCPIFSVHSGVKGEGFSTMVLPATRAGATFHMARLTGKFHGAIAQTTPRGT